MGHTLTAIPFFSDEITLKPHTASRADLIERRVSIREFANGRPVSLDRVDETGEYVVRAFAPLGRYYGVSAEFMQGPEV